MLKILNPVFYKCCSFLYICQLLSGVIILECTSHTFLASDFQLRNLHVIFRHGDRSPIVDLPEVYPSFTYSWPAGLGQLTDQGIVQQFELGEFLRSKYTDFIPEKYNGSHYHMRSTDVDRTLMSALANIAGFYNRSHSPLHRYGINWTPVPVHTVSQNNDILLNSAKCPLLNFLQNQQMNSEKAISFERNHSALFGLLNNVSGLESVNRSNVWMINDIIICMRAHNLSLPWWANDSVLEELNMVDLFYWALKYAQPLDVVRLEIGVFLYYFVEHVRSVIHGAILTPTLTTSLSTKHIMAYSAHDTDITYVLSAFGVYDKLRINYASAVVLELYGPEPPAKEHQYYLRLLYKRGYKDPTGEYLTIPACHRQTSKVGCPLDLVLKQIEPLLLSPKAFKHACGIYPDSTKTVLLHPAFYIFIGIVLASIVVLFIYTIRTCRLKRRSHEILQESTVGI